MIKYFYANQWGDIFEIWKINNKYTIWQDGICSTTRDSKQRVFNRLKDAKTAIDNQDVWFW